MRRARDMSNNIQAADEVELRTLQQHLAAQRQLARRLCRDRVQAAARLPTAPPAQELSAALAHARAAVAAGSNGEAVQALLDAEGANAALLAEVQALDEELGVYKRRVATARAKTQVRMHRDWA